MNLDARIRKLEAAVSGVSARRVVPPDTLEAFLEGLAAGTVTPCDYGPEEGDVVALLGRLDAICTQREHERTSASEGPPDADTDAAR
jgi:hypothetical protein